MPENERALSARVLELEGALNAQYEAIESLRWARAQLERALQRVSQERDEALSKVSQLQAELDRQRTPSEPWIQTRSGLRDAQPTVRILMPVGVDQEAKPTVPAPPRERSPSVGQAERRERVADSGTYSVLDVSEERLSPRRRRRVGR